MGWWGPGIFDGDVPLDCYDDLVNVVGVAAVMGADTVVALPFEWTAADQQLVASIDGFVERVAAWLSERVMDVDAELHAQIRCELDSAPGGGGDRDRPYNVNRGLLDGTAVDVDALDAAARDELATQLVHPLADARWRAAVLSDYSYAAQVAVGTLMAAGVDIPDEVRAAAAAACADDPRAAHSPARQAAVDGFAATLASYRPGTPAV